MKHIFRLLPVAATLVVTPAFADEPKGDAPPPTADGKPTAAEKKLGYSLPWLLRPSVATTALRLDQNLVFQDGSSVQLNVLTASYKLMPDAGLFARAAIVRFAPEGKDAKIAISNPVVGAVFAPEIAPHTRLAAVAGLAVPVGSGGGNDRDDAVYGAIGAGIYGRQGMDNALFAVNYLTPFLGAGVSYVDKGFTAQLDLTVLELFRARGADKEVDEKRTNSMAALHVGYRVIPMLTVSAELHHQRWLSTPAAVDKDGNKRSQTTVGGGVRLNLPVGEAHVIRPGVAYFMGVDDPMAYAKAKVILVDVPFVF